MPRTPKPRLRRVFELDNEWFLIGDADDEGFHAVRLTGADRELAIKMEEENQVKMEATLTRRR